ncbi:hypothetical protein HG537_0H03950 [Torulaspora globosa]|uniref:Uncharacterized protein n=1 Tax=Torulaspora globosa TaxID=48254 RepID=A0A7H9I1F3_9SACH|nr:hypothetical protein HG537_0H03950 [Torulaspora sp. CBS 2947]
MSGGKPEEIDLESDELIAEMCPQCGEFLQKCLIQQNYAMIICPSLQCAFPFNQNKAVDNIVYVDENEVLEVARQRLTKS